MKAAVALRLPTAHPLVAFLLVLVAFHVAEEPWPLTVQAARRPTEKRAHGPSTYPRDYYLGEYGARCVGNVTGAVTPDDAAERLACFSGRGVRVALLDTGCAPASLSAAVTPLPAQASCLAWRAKMLAAPMGRAV
ncbi:hypothetical_protein (plasmid) [Leishmania braziliensis MHOM/BR/75/M2904]|uniref:Hypothetical_protein n=1 Tax=Leishmania braziliensis MHOM/BR/75/M2904 TaxID=420245 RepID=A0A3P3Z186_LEIBR|nr:hypothetical_protein [Leishmania braziliensis MHOM/BR/75/M2904]